MGLSINASISSVKVPSWISCTRSARCCVLGARYLPLSRRASIATWGWEIPAGQREAGQVLGLTRSQIFFQVTLLQMVKRIVPPMSNEVITLVKDTSLAKTISIMELIMTGESYMKSAGIVWPLFYTAVFYLAFVGILTLLFNYIERKLSYFR